MANRAVMLIGHQQLWNDFVAQVDAKKLHHAQLFLGPKGVGKTKFALELAAYLQGVSAHPVEKTQLFRGLDADTLLFLDEGEMLPIEKVRGMLARSGQSHARPYLIVILEDLGRLKVEAMNTLLKTLEEPGEDVFFFLTANKEEDVLPTIRSRCHMTPFNLVDEQSLKAACDGHVQTEALVSFAMGRPGKLRRLLEDSEYFALHQSMAQDAQLFLVNPRASQAFALVRKYENDPHTEELLDILLARARTYLLQGHHWTRFLERIEDAKADLKHNVNRRLVLENLFLTLAL